jgi:hypothetical protein
MAMRFKFASLIVFALAVLFDKFFMFAKHSRTLSPINPFANDPYDAIGSIAMIVGTLLALLCLFRAFQPGQKQPALPLRVVILVRAQIAIIAGVLVALGGDLAAMLRNLSEWTSKPAAVELLALMAGMVATALTVLFFVRRTVKGIPPGDARGETKRASAVVLACIVVLVLYPEQMIRNVPLHFLTIFLGFVIFLAPVSALAVAVLPYEMTAPRIEASTPRFFLPSWMQWGVVAIIGLAAGSFPLFGEMFVERGSSAAASIPLNRVLIVCAAYLGSGLSALLLAFAFLGKPLGLFRRVLN